MLPLGAGRFMHLVVPYGYPGADTDAKQLALTEQLFGAALGELGVVARGQRRLFQRLRPVCGARTTCITGCETRSRSEEKRVFPRKTKTLEKKLRTLSVISTLHGLKGFAEVLLFFSVHS